jgi:site-specific recombinase XerC
MILLSNGCRMSNPTVNPKEWKTGGVTLLKKDWLIQYRFYDPKFKDDVKFAKGKLILVRGMNEFKNLPDRRLATKALIDDIVNDHLHEGFNPITKTFFKAEQIDYEINPRTKFIDALQAVMNLKFKDSNLFLDFKSVLKYTKEASEKLRFDSMPISDIKRRHLRILLDFLGTIKKNWTANNYNHYRKYLSILFNQLVEMETLEYNPLEKITKKKTIQRIRKTLTDDERSLVDNHLKKNHYEFWRYMQLFFHSGRRSTELLNVKKLDVFIVDQKFKVLEKKGNVYREIWVPIKSIAVPLWLELLNAAKPTDYIFGKFLKPGAVATCSHQITKRWRLHVKEKLNIEADFYSLKHSNADDIAKAHSLQLAQQFIGHSSAAMTRIYATGQSDRDLDALKLVSNEFAKKAPPLQ